MKSISEELNLNNKKILLRLDLNVPLVDGKITDTTRIDKIIPTLKFLISQNTKIIIISHVGRPKGEVVNELSLRPICNDLKIKLSQNIKLISKDVKEIDGRDLFENDEFFKSTDAFKKLRPLYEDLKNEVNKVDARLLDPLSP